MGAKKVVKNFDEVEAKIKTEEEVRVKNAADVQVQEEAITSRLQYQETTTKRDLGNMDEAKQAQAERLGMGIGRATTNKLVFSHSASNSMSVVVQQGGEEHIQQNRSFLDREPDVNWTNNEKDYEIKDREPPRSYSSSSRPSEDDGTFGSRDYGRAAEKEKTADFFSTYDAKTSRDSSSFGSGRNSSSSASSRPDSVSRSSAPVEIDMKKYGKSKSISSNQFFASEQQGSSSFNDAYTGPATSISSDGYFGNGSTARRDGGKSSKLTDVAFNVLDRLQDRFG